ncbi:UDP-glucose/GDP-mannose dehydrogenase family protein [Candidatus Bathyarchaeota archaeon A05DMB-2]|jgi:UDPglucose 6-dehydrogenase|nr:UDP-glucose/GDP-mannose dehydrogenase family protein [Candidatus Bathyarchaeota archaeon A05DMB-2]
MRINVIGYGTVGKAQAFLMRKLEHEVFIFDPYVFPSITAPEESVDLTFICTPENAVDESVQALIKERVKGLYVIKSTLSVGTTEALMKKYSVHIMHNPEFLRENSAYEDVKNPDRIIIGQCCKEHGEKLASLYSPMKKPVYITDPTTSEVAKLLSNSHLAMLITFWNEANELAQKLGLNIRELAEMVTADSRISSYGTDKFGEPFEGKCLPANLDQLITAFHGAGSNPLLFEAIKKYNQRLSK